MALRQPIALENASGSERPNADEFRLMLQHLAGDGEVASPSSAGVVGATALKVTERAGTPNMSVDVAAGWAFVAGTEVSPAGIYGVYNDATVNVAVPAADGTNPRKDLVIVRVRDSQYSGAFDDAQLLVVAGTPAPSPVEPDLDALGYKNYLRLALIDVPALDTAITNSQITDRRVASSVWTRPRGLIAKRTSTVDHSTTTEGTISGFDNITWTGVAGRIIRYRFQGQIRVSHTSAAAAYVRITDLSNVTVAGAERIIGVRIAASGEATAMMSGTYTETLTTSGTVGRRARLVRGTGGTAFLDGTATTIEMTVEDAGGALL